MADNLADLHNSAVPLTGGSEDDWFLTSVGDIFKDRLPAETVTSII